MLPYLKTLLDLPNAEVVSNILRALLFLTAGNDELVSKVLEKVPLNSILQHVKNGNVEIVMLALKVLGNICAGSSELATDMLSGGPLFLLAQLLETVVDPRILKEVCWIISNLAAGPVVYLQRLLDSGLIKHMCILARPSTPYNVIIFISPLGPQRSPLLSSSCL